MATSTYITFMITKESIPKAELAKIFNIADDEEVQMYFYDFLHPTRTNTIVQNYLITEYNVKIIKHELYNLFIFKKEMMDAMQNLLTLLQLAATMSQDQVNIVRFVRHDIITRKIVIEPVNTV